MSNDLNKIVEQAYVLFSGNKPDSITDACTSCCMSEEDAQLLLSTPLRQIPLDLLSQYQDAAKPLNLNLKEVKYFLPRYLDLISVFKFPSYEPCLALTRLSPFSVDGWNKEESNLLEAFSMQFFAEYVETMDHPEFVLPSEILLMFHKGGINVTSLLELWSRTTSLNGLIHFNWLLREIRFSKNNDVVNLDMTFSDDTFITYIYNWMSSETVHNHFIQLYDLYETELKIYLDERGEENQCDKLALLN
jgi:hypothetical protein